MKAYEGLINDITVILEKLDVNESTGKEFRQLSNTLEKVFRMVIRDGEYSVEKILDTQTQIREKIVEVDHIKTALLKQGQYEYYYNIIIGYEKLLRIDQLIQLELLNMKRVMNLPQHKR